MINLIKDDIYSFFKIAMNEKFPEVFVLDENGFSEKIYWAKRRDVAPSKPYIILNDAIKGKINKAHETYKNEHGQTVKRENWMMVVTFAVYNACSDGDTANAEVQATEYIEFIQDLFNSEETFYALSKNDIIVDEKQVSNIRDLSSFEETNYSYRFEIDVTFNFDIIKEVESTEAQGIKYEIDIKETDLNIKGVTENG